MKSHGTLSRFPLILAGALVVLAVGFMAYLSTVNPMPAVAHVEREISLEGLSSGSPEQAAPPVAVPAADPLPLPKQDDHDVQ